MKHKLILIITLLIFFQISLFYSCSSNEEASDPADSAISEVMFVGDQACRSCHAEQASAWKGSHHDYAMKRAGEKSVRGNFNNATFTHRGDRYRFFRDDSLYMVEAPGPNGEQVRYQITHTFGWEPLQQYLVDFGKGKLQALNIAWDTEREEWFVLNPEEELDHGDWLHWTGGAMNWNTMCADCHSTNLQKNYIASADSFHTTWSSINVSCESCHGPGGEHVAFMQSQKGAEATIQRIRQDLQLTGAAAQEQQINQCAQCHSLREELTGRYKHQGDFLNHYNPVLPHPEAYFPDGQIKEEVYVYGSFLQSRMFEKGVKCDDCHDPHSLELKANVVDNSLCMQCHAPKYNTADHHKHQVDTEGGQCISCHMPGRYYMEVDFRRDHSFRVPRPDLSSKHDTPNACNSCHEDRSAEWAAAAVSDWYGPSRQDRYSEILARANAAGEDAIPLLNELVSDTAQPDIARATAIWYLGQFGDPATTDLLEQTLNDENPLVRASTARALSGFTKNEKLTVLQDALDDPVRAVRMGAVGGLAEFSVSEMAFNHKQHFNDAIREYNRYLNANQYFPQGQMNRGQFLEKRGQLQEAIKAYQATIGKDPQFNPARINLAHLYNRQGNNDKAERQLKEVIEQEPDYGPAHYSLGLLLGEENRTEQAVTHFRRASELMPDHARVRYNWAISLQQLGRPVQAEQAYLEAIALAPDNPDYRYGICTLYIQQEQYEETKPHAAKLQRLRPNDQRVQNVVRIIKERTQ